MRILTIDTSAVASAALLEFSPDGPLGSHSVVEQFATADTRSHAEVLAPGVNSLFTDPVQEGPQLAAIVVGTGPGPFTGLRAGIAMARTLAFTWNVPLFGLMSLEALAEEVRLSTRTEHGFAIATDARRKEVYWATYASDGMLLQGPNVGPIAELADLADLADLAVTGLPVYGAGAGLYAPELQAAGLIVDPAFSQSQPTALYLGLAAIRRIVAAGSIEDAGLSDTAPLYLRESDAKVPSPRKRAL